MPPQSKIVLPYQSGKWPDAQASAKFARLNGGAGSKDARSADPALPCRKLASAIQANGTAHSKAAAQGNSMTRNLSFIMDPALQVAQGNHRQGKQERHADHRRGRRQAGIVILMRLLIDVIQH